MRDDMREVCGECKWHRKDADGDWMCFNTESEFYCDWTDYSDTCEEYEQRGIE